MKRAYSSLVTWLRKRIKVMLVCNNLLLRILIHGFTADILLFFEAIMIYNITKVIFRKACHIFFKKITIIGDRSLIGNRPVILALNHPNSFLDAIVTAVHVKGGIHSLTRGDAFKNKVVARLLKTYLMIPVFRISEGKENVEKNFETFDTAQQILFANKTILIFSEGLCENNWDFRPLKKGTARLAKEAWSNSATANTVVIPLGLTYEHYSGAGKSLIMNFGEPIYANDFTSIDFQSGFTAVFNQLLQKRLGDLIYINKTLEEGSEQHKKFMSNWDALEQKFKGADLLTGLKKGFSESTEIKPKLFPSSIHKTIVLIPHYWFCKWLTFKLTKGNVFYDSILLGLLVFILPVYLLILAAAVYLVTAFTFSF